MAFALSDQNTALFILISKTVVIFLVSLVPMTAPINPSRGILVAMLGATRDFAANVVLDTEPSS